MKNIHTMPHIHAMEKLWSERISEKMQALWGHVSNRAGFGDGSGAHAPQAEPSKKSPGRKAPQPFKSSPVPEDWKQQVLTNVPVYPPFRNGLPMLPVAEIIQSQVRLIREIYGATGVNQELWKKIYLPVIHSYANYVHLLPASEGNHHRGAGGLFRHGLEASLYAVRLTDGQDSLEKSAHLLHPTERRRHEDALRLATFCAGLLHDIGKPIVDMQIYDQDKGTLWNPALYPSLYEWGRDNDVSRYNLRWRTGRMDRHKNLGMATAPHLLNRDVLAFLADVDAFWVETLLRAIAGDEMGMNKVRDFATYGDRESVRYDLKNQGGEGNDIGIPVERYLLDAMRTMIRERAWKVNEPGAVIWTTAIPSEAVEREIPAGTVVLAMIWPKAATDVVGVLHQQGTPGIPKDPQIVADMLIDRDIAVPSRAETEGQQRIPFWFLSPEDTGGVGGTDPVGQRVLVFRHPEYLLDIVPPLSMRKLYSVKAPPSAEKLQAASGQNESKKENTNATQTPAQKKQDGHESHKPAPTQKPTPGNDSTRQQENIAKPSADKPQTEQTTEKQPANKPAYSRIENDSISMGTRVLRAVVTEILLKRQDVGVLIPIHEEESWLKFPDALKDMGMKPIEVLGILNDEHLVIPSPESPEKLTQKKTIPGINKEQNVVVLSPLALQKIPCLRMQLAVFPKENQVTYHRFLLEHAKDCPEAKFSAEKTTKKGYWFIPIEWVVARLREQFKEDPCPERFLRECAIGPGSEGGGLVLRLPSDLDNGVDA